MLQSPTAFQSDSEYFQLFQPLALAHYPDLVRAHYGDWNASLTGVFTTRLFRPFNPQLVTSQPCTAADPIHNCAGGTMAEANAADVCQQCLNLLTFFVGRSTTGHQNSRQPVP